MTEATRWPWLPAATRRRRQRAPGHPLIHSLFVCGLRVGAALCLHLSLNAYGEEALVHSLNEDLSYGGKTISRLLRYTLTLRNTTSSPVSTELQAAVPVRRSMLHGCRRVETSHPCKLRADSHGNQTLVFQRFSIPPYGSLNVSVSSIVDLPVRYAPPSTPEIPVSECAYNEVRHAKGKIALLAAKLEGRDRHDTAHNILRWVHSNIRYSGPRRNNRGAEWALVNRRGDCSESSSLFQSLCLANGIPARRIVGVVCSANTVLRPSQLHEWCEFHDGKNWQAVDAQKNLFGRRLSNYISFVVHEDDPSGGTVLFSCDSENVRVELRK